MKNFKVLLSAFITLLIISCEGPEGPEGLPGPQTVAPAFELINRDLIFDSANNIYELTFQSYPSDINVFFDDVVLIYRLEEILPDDTLIWRQLPQPVATNEGLLFYNFDFTERDFNVYIEPQFDGTLVSSELFQNQTFRIVVIPADLGTSKLDTSNMEAVLSALNIDEAAIRRIK